MRRCSAVAAKSTGAGSLAILLKEIRGCTLCAKDLVDGVRPVVRARSSARILVAGQAPGSKVHATGIPFDDPSGDRLREWMAIDASTFYDDSKIALVPMGFCYPGKGKSGDLPPRPICADTWRQRLVNALPNLRLVLVIGQYAQAWHLDKVEKNLTETVRSFRDYGQQIMPLPHPSPRNNIWLKRNPWFDTDVLPELRLRVLKALGE